MTGVRARFNAFVTAHETAWELSMAALALAFVATGFVPETERGGLFAVLDDALTIVFVAEFAARFGASYHRGDYLRGHWVDLFALIPAVRGFRILRLLRLLRLVRAFAGVYRAVGHFEQLARHRGLLLLLVVWLAVVVISSLSMYAAENGVNKAVNSPLDALWWGVVTLTTVGYGDVVPVTPEGRIAATVLMVLGIALFSAITATMVSALSAADQEERGGDNAADRLRRLEGLRNDGLISVEEYAAKRSELVELL